MSDEEKKPFDLLASLNSISKEKVIAGAAVVVVVVAAIFVLTRRREGEPAPPLPIAQEEVIRKRLQELEKQQNDPNNKIKIYNHFIFY